jgi:hypothetical protein
MQLNDATASQRAKQLGAISIPFGFPGWSRNKGESPHAS